MSHDLKIVCTYTANSPYEAEARQLAESAAQFGYSVRGIAVPEQGDWWRNVGIKPSYVLEALESHHGPLLFLDADCLILEPLDELLALLDVADLSVKYRPGNCLSALFNAAVLLARRTPATLQVVKTWAERGRDFAHLHRFSEQGAFAEGMIYAQRDLRFAPLPERFHMFPQPGIGGPPPGCVILHNKTSNKVRQTALPTTPPALPCLLAPDVQVVCVGPTNPNASPGLPMGGLAGLAADFNEYASRYGIRKYWTIGVNGAAQNPLQLEQAKILAMRKLFAQFPVGARVIFSDHNITLLRNPQRIADCLADADLACAFPMHRGHRQRLPATALFGMKLTDAVRDVFLIDLERTHARLAHEMVAGELLPLAMAEVFRRLEGQIRVADMPESAVADLGSASAETIGVSMTGELSCIPGDMACHTYFTPAPHLSAPALQG